MHFIGGTVGGGFGGKVDTLTEPLSILGAMLTGRPVRYMFDREEEMHLWRAARRRAHLSSRTASRATAASSRASSAAYFDSGAYTRLSSYAVVKCAAHLPGPYTIPNVSRRRLLRLHQPHAGDRDARLRRHARSISRIECQMDKLAHLVGMDPMEFRILNAYRDGDMKAHRREAKNTALIECVQVAAEKANWPLRDEFKRMSSRKDGGGARAAMPPTPREPIPAAAPRPSSARRTTAPAPPPPEPLRRRRRLRSPAPAGGSLSHGATRFSSVFGARRR